MAPEFRLMLGYEIYRSYRDLVESTKAGEDMGFTAMFRGDHLLSVDGRRDISVTEAWTSLAGLARETKSIHLGTMVSPVAFRNPAVLARMVATVHEMSDGRAEVGLGAGWYEPEHEGFGLPLPPWPERFDQLEEQLEIVRGLLTQERVDFNGRHYRVATGLGPYRGEAAPPPVVVGGNGKPRTIALAARFSDELNLDQIPDPVACRVAFDRLDADLQALGRPLDSVVRSNVVPWPGDDFGAAAEAYAAMEAAGVQRLYVKRPPTTSLGQLGAFAKRFIG
jgi:alkanesulfonate monooxygenase SsuD/methylene tetrahydromethanopterin reductase-like flavin-dependent oxidoreductase (luciferase family)